MSKEEDINLIEEYIKISAERNNWDLTKNLHNIAKAKYRMFGIDNWRKCPCYSVDDNIHGCETKACADVINNEGICHCNLFKKKDS